MKPSRLIALFCAFILAAPTQEATASDLVTYQGKLTDAAADPLPDGQYWLGARIWDTASGGTTPLWSRKYQVPVTGGLFSLMLGATGSPWETPPPLTASLKLALAGTSRFVEITVMSNAGQPEKPEGEWQILAPRQALGAVPFAMNGAPPGTVVPFAGSLVPEGWLLCDGEPYSTGDRRYAALFAVIQTTYGSGAGFFRVPDLKGRTVIGSGKGDTWLPNGNDQSTAWVRGQKFGAEKHQLILTEMPRHGHDVEDLGHRHNFQSPNGVRVGSGNSVAVRADTTSAFATELGKADISETPKGNDQPHNNMQPTLVLNYIIKL